MIAGAAPEAEVYASDPGRAPDSAFEPGALRHLVVGREGRLLDPRRTPVRVVGLHLAHGHFEVEVRAFEDAGARWLIPVESCAGYQFAPGEDATPEALAALEDVVRRLDRPLALAADPAARVETRRRLAAERAAAARWLDERRASQLDLAARIRTREVDARIAGLLEEWLARAGLAELDAAFAATWVSNPRSGELVKGHAIVVAELGLCPFAGSVVRDPELFHGAASKERRAEHLLRRMGFVQALLARAPSAPPLYRGMHFEGAASPRRLASFVSATFSLEVATANFAGGAGSSGVLLRQPLPLERLFMTFLETRALSRSFREAEAILVGPAGDGSF
jgi:hypothetical protein